MGSSRPLIGNYVVEQDIRDYLTDRGYRGDLTRFEYLKLFSIERPGWIQVFIFCLVVRDDGGNRHRFFGVLRDDERSGSIRIHLAETAEEQFSIADAWSTGIITAPRSPLSRIQWALMGLFGTLIVTALLGALLSR
jgi:hypothetical protein